MVYDRIIEGQTINMRSVIPDDAEITYAMRMDSEKVRYMHRISGTVEDQRAYIVNQNNKSGDYLFLVLDKSGKPIGMRGIYNVREDSAESGRTIGYGDAFQNIEAILLGFDFAFEKLQVKSIYMDAFADNSTVIGIQKQMGAMEIERNHIDGLECENIRSVLYRDVYLLHRGKVMKLIVRHADKMASRLHQ